MKASPEEYTVERVLRARVKQFGRGRKAVKGWEYFVKWAEYPESDNSWEPEDSFKDGSEHFLDGFWARIKSHDRANVTQYDLNAEAFPTGPPRKGKKPSLVAKTSSTSTSVVEDSEMEVQSAVDNDAGSSRKKRRASAMPPGSSEELPAKRTRRKSTRAAAASEPKATATRSSADTSSSTSKTSSAVAPKRTASRRKTAPDPVVASSSRRTKTLAISRFAPTEDAASVDDETLPSADSTFDIANVLDMIDTQNSSPPSATTSRTAQKKAMRDFYVGPSGSRDGHPGSPPLTNGPGTTSSLTVVNQGDSVGRPKASIMNLFSRFSKPLSISGSGTLTGHPVPFPPMNPPPNSSMTERNTAESKENGVDDGDVLAENGSEDAEGEIDEDFLPTNEAMNVEEGTPVQMGSPRHEDALVVQDAPAENGPVSEKQTSRSRTFSNVWSNTIFGPLGLGRISLNSNPSSAPGDEQPFCTVKLSSSVTISLLLKEVHPSTDASRESLDVVVIGSKGQIPGKFYKSDHALALASAFSSTGSCASAVLGDDATSEEKEQFQRFKARLMDGHLFVTPVGIHTLAICAASNSALGTKLGISSDLVGREDEVLVTEVTISDDAAYCDAVMLADSIQW